MPLRSLSDKELAALNELFKDDFWVPDDDGKPRQLLLPYDWKLLYIKKISMWVKVG